MGNQCVKTNPGTDIMDMRDEKSRREYYLNMNQNGGPSNGENSALGQDNYDIREQRLVGYGHIQKVNMFHHISKCKSILSYFQYIYI